MFDTKIGELLIRGNVFLAPMAGVTDLPFREMCAEMGAALTYTEMVSAKGLMYNNENTKALLEVSEAEGRAAVQLFGSDPESLGAAAAVVSRERECCLIDLNCGCPAPKIVRSGEGSALMKDLGLLGRLVRAMSENAAGVPVTVKIRKGYDERHINAVEAALTAEENGAAAVCVHGRTRTQMYEGTADWGIIKEIKKNISVPVIGNGDVTCPEDAKRLIEETGCDAVMVGRAAWGNPWIFNRTIRYLLNGELVPEPTVHEKAEAALKYLSKKIAEKGEIQGIRESRRHLAMFIKGLRFSAQARSAINTETTREGIKAVLDILVKDNS